MTSYTLWITFETICILENLMKERFKTMLDLAKILQGMFLGKNATFPHYYDQFFAK